MSLDNLLLQSPLGRRHVARRNPDSTTGHAHFWQRAALSRRGFLGTAGAAMGARLALPSALRAASDDILPNPIPGGLDLLGNGHIFHVYLPGTSPELSTITDFNGVLGAADILGSWSGGGVTPPPNTPLVFDAEMRFMAGEYIARNGQRRQGVFAFV
jgi:hypothetical protein